jgi:hypothetical protein
MMSAAAQCREDIESESAVGYSAAEVASIVALWLHWRRVNVPAKKGST